MKVTLAISATTLFVQAHAQGAPFLLSNGTTSQTLGTGGTAVSPKTTISVSDSLSSIDTATFSSSFSSNSTFSSSIPGQNATGLASLPSVSGSSTDVPLMSSTALSFNSTTTQSASVVDGTGVTTSTASTDAGITLAPSIVGSGNGSGIVIGSFTLTPGGSAFMSGTVSISLASSGILNVDGSTMSLSGSTTSTSGTSTSANTASGSLVITSTMTTVPTGVSTELITLSGPTTNTWITTTKGDSTTIVPVIWCSDCGGGLVIWNFPPIPSVLFDWVSVFPKLPKFDLPCVKVFGIQVSGDCPDPETKDDLSDDGDDDGSSSSTSSTSSSTQSCSAGTTTVSDCRIGCSLSYSTIDSSISSTTICYTTSCEQTVGCSLQATTSTSISTSSISGDSCPFSATESYDAIATYSSLGMDLPAWMAFPLTYIFSTTDSNTATANSSTASSASSTNTTSIAPSTSSEAFPTLSATSTGIGTSSGRTCASTATFERCNGSGGRSFCATTSSCASWVATSTPATSTREPTTSSPSPTPTPTIALTVQAPICHNEADFPGHADINPASVPQGASKFCGKNKVDMTPDSPKISENYQNIYSVNYLYEVEWVDGCATSDNTQSVEDPVGDDNWKCSDLFQRAYDGCNNGGVGGSVEAGCLRYTFTGGLGDS